MAQIFTNFDQLVKLGRIGRAKGMAGKVGIKAVVSLDVQEGDLVSVNASIFQSKKWESVYKVAFEHIAAKFGKNAVRLAFTYYEIEQKRIDRFIELAPEYLNVANIEEPEVDEQSYVLSCYSDKATVGIFAEKA
jgi:fatty acid-binding protein DegV